MKSKLFDRTLFIAVITLVIFGIIMIYSSSYVWASYKYNDALKYVSPEFILYRWNYNNDNCIEHTI